MARTKAPWRVNGDGAHVARVSSSVNITAVLVPVTHRPNDGQLADDAALLAAAPDLHDALAALVALIERDRTIDPRDYADAIADGRTALAKATALVTEAA